jgi:hypothetical protein
VASIKSAEEHKHNTKILQKHKNRTQKKQEKKNSRKYSYCKKTPIYVKKWVQNPKLGIALIS